MERPHVLASLNGRVLVAYSRDTVSALRGMLPLRLLLPHLEPLLAANVEKEVRKDVLVIRRASELAASGARVSSDAVIQLMDATKLIDRDFVDRVRALPVRVVIPYEQIAPIRMQRIECLMECACRVFSNWHRGVRLRAALHAAYPQADFEHRLYRILQLYALETRALSRVVRLPALLVPLREQAGASVVRAMENVAARLAADVARSVYLRRGLASPFKPLQ